MCFFIEDESFTVGTRGMINQEIAESIHTVLWYSAILVAALIETEGLVGYLAYLQTNHNNSYTFSPCSSFFNLQHIKKNAHSSIYFYFNCILSRASSGCTVNYETCPYRLLPSKLLFSLVTVALQ